MLAGVPESSHLDRDQLERLPVYSGKPQGVIYKIVN